MASTSFLVLRLDAPMQSWGRVAMDPVRPTYAHPTRSGLAGMIASALGWRYSDGARTTALQDALRYGVREDRPARILRDYHTADLGRIGRESWTRWGIERRGGGPAASGTQILDKHYLADAVFVVAFSLDDDSPVNLDEVAQALRSPARPLFLGRKGCLPATPILVGEVQALSSFEALAAWPSDSRSSAAEVPCWYQDGDGPAEGEPEEIWDRRDFVTDRFAGSRIVRRHRVRPAAPGPVEE
jgi:CRISPR system Cascade subunit CasD